MNVTQDIEKLRLIMRFPKQANSGQPVIQLKIGASVE
jgi:hypothetical protein